MGSSIILWYKEKCRKQWKTAFIATFIIGLLTHAYKFLNFLPNHDSFLNIYHSQNILASGRWFLSIACGLSSFYDLPWITGLFTLFFAATAMVIITEFFKIDNPILIIICSALLVTYPAITNTLYYSYTADGYMLAMALAALSAFLMRFEQKNKLLLLTAALSLCLTCGIYQAYVSFALVLILCGFIKDLIENNRTVKEYFSFIFSRIGLIATGLAAYYIIWQLCMFFQDTTATDYQGISEIGNNIDFIRILKLPASLVFSYISVMLETVNGKLTAAGILNLVFLICFAVTAILIFIRNKIYQNIIRTVLFLFSFTLIPTATYIWLFTTEHVGYHILMLQSIAIVYIFAAILFEKLSFKKVRAFCALLLVIISLNYAVLANTGYHLLQRSYEASYAQTMQMAIRIDEKAEQEDFDTIAIVNTLPNETYNSAIPGNGTPYINSQFAKITASSHRNIYEFLRYYFNVNLISANEDLQNEIQKSEEFKSMDVWPAKDSVKVIDNVIVIKLGE